MRDAIGGALSIQIILVFLVLINSYLAFSVNYTKAFRVKNNIIAILEQQEGFTNNAKANIENTMMNAGYSIKNISRLCGSEYTTVINNAGGFCLAFHQVNDKSGGYYSVKTFISIDIPILNNFLPALSNTFAIKGETKTIYSSNAIPLEEQ